MAGELADMINESVVDVVEAIALQVEMIDDAFKRSSPLLQAFATMLDENRPEAAAAGHDFQEEGLDDCPFCDRLRSAVPGMVRRMTP